jgi:hypothetical protein
MARKLHVICGKRTFNLRAFTEKTYLRKSYGLNVITHIFRNKSHLTEKMTFHVRDAVFTQKVVYVNTLVLSFRTLKKMIRPDFFARIMITSIGHSRCGLHAGSKHGTHLIPICNLCDLFFHG